MRKHYQVIKRCALIFCNCCIIFSLVFLAQMQEQKRQIQTLQNLKTETQRLQEENETVGTVAQLEEENKEMARELAYKRQLILSYEENGQVMKELAERIPVLQSYYDKGVYLDSLAAELDRENGSRACIARYFKIEKGELEEILGETKLVDQLQAGLPDVYQWGCLLPVGDGIWVRYEENDVQNALPTGVVIQNPLLDIGYEDARAGMYIFDIEKSYPGSTIEETEIEEVESVRGIDTHHFHHISYLRYMDDEFIYYYVALDGYGDAVIVYIVPNNG